MTDLHIPNFVTSLDGEAIAHVNGYHDQVTYLEAKATQAVDAQHVAEEQQARAEARAHDLAEERDSAMQLVHELLAERIGQACWDEGLDSALLADRDLDALCEGLFEDWSHGVALGDLDARAVVRGWDSERGLQ